MDCEFFNFIIEKNIVQSIGDKNCCKAWIGALAAAI